MSDDRRSPRTWSARVTGIVQAALFVTLILSIIYTAAQMSQAPVASSDPGERIRSDYILMLIQCAGGLIVMFLPNVVHRRWSITVPTAMQIAYFVFLYAAIYLGEVRSFYYRFTYWDNILHFLSGLTLGALGFFLVQLLNDAENHHVTLSPKAVAFFSFCFGVASGAIWEIYEFTIDGIFGTNMQKFATDTGELLVGRHALGDTMVDLILDAVAALIVSIIGYIGLRASLAPRQAVATASDTETAEAEELH